MEFCGDQSEIFDSQMLTNGLNSVSEQQIWASKGIEYPIDSQRCTVPLLIELSNNFVEP